MCFSGGRPSLRAAHPWCTHAGLEEQQTRSLQEDVGATTKATWGHASQHLPPKAEKAKAALAPRPGSSEHPALLPRQLRAPGPPPPGSSEHPALLPPGQLRAPGRPPQPRAGPARSRPTAHWDGREPPRARTQDTHKAPADKMAKERLGFVGVQRSSRDTRIPSLNQLRVV